MKKRVVVGLSGGVDSSVAYHEHFKERFNQLINELLNEKSASSVTVKK